MRNHDEKNKNMQRSVLPSTARRGARDERRRTHKAARAREREALTAFDAADLDGFDPDYRESKRLSDIHWMVLDRRTADKIGPLTRWAVATVNANPDLRDAPLHEQVAYFAALLPTDLIGAHAVQHIEWALRYQAIGNTLTDWRAADQERHDRRREQVAEQARRLLAAGHHGALNRALRKAYGAVIGEDGSITLGPPGRFLAGAHDVDAFAEAVAGSEQVRDVIANLAARLT